MAMLHRFDILLHDYQDLENADHWNPEKKIRFALELFRLWEGLRVSVDRLQHALT